MSEKWDFYLTRIKDKPASVFVDMGIASEAPKEDYSVRLAVLVKQKHPRADGLTSQEEADRLWPLEDALLHAVREWGGKFVGRVTTDGRRDFIFYGSSANGFDAAVSKAMVPFSYDFDTLDQADAGWNFYFDVLYPTPWDWQTIMNRHVLENLKRGGDDLSKPRRLFHWLYFSTLADRDQCAEAARAKGFGARVLSALKKPETRNPFGLQLHRIDSIGPQSVNEVCFELFTLAKETSGEYDGWETQIVGSSAEFVGNLFRKFAAVR